MATAYTAPLGARFASGGPPQFGQAVRLALKSIQGNRARATLTVLGISIGVAAVVTIMSLASGAAALVGGEIAGFGANVVFVAPREMQQSGARVKTPGRLTEADGKAIATGVRGASGVATWLAKQGQAIHGDKNVSTLLIGANADYFPIRKWTLTKGATWLESDERLKTKVCVLGSSVRDRLFGRGANPVGSTIRLGAFPFRVVGVLGERGESPYGEDQDDRILMPIGSFRARLMPTTPGRVDQLLVSVASPDRVPAVVNAIRALIRQRHMLPAEAPDDVEIDTQAETQEAADEIMDRLSLLLVTVASISLLVGGVGVMNIMLVTVTERTREIGIRLSIGATARDILFQFLVEAVVLALIGGALGSVVGSAATWGLACQLGWPLHPTPGALLVATGTCTTIGLLFGFLPAHRAAQLDPIEALRNDS